jgi:hypothetical protein
MAFAKHGWMVFAVMRAGQAVTAANLICSEYFPERHL